MCSSLFEALFFFLSFDNLCLAIGLDLRFARQDCGTGGIQVFPKLIGTTGRIACAADAQSRVHGEQAQLLSEDLLFILLVV
jgi:hypothetical protein